MAFTQQDIDTPTCSRRWQSPIFPDSAATLRLSIALLDAHCAECA